MQDLYRSSILEYRKCTRVKLSPVGLSCIRILVCLFLGSYTSYDIHFVDNAVYVHYAQRDNISFKKTIFYKGFIKKI